MSPLTRRVTAEYRNANHGQRLAGHRWYADAHEIAVSQSGTYGVTVETASGILAALSPRMNWGKNVMMAERVLMSEGTIDKGCLTRSLIQANAIYHGTPALDVLGGPKTRAFYEAILTTGGSETPVIDVHAWDMLLGQRGSTPPTNAQYRVAAEKMKRAAAILGESVHNVQATTWLTWRARWWKPGTNDHRPQTMLEGAMTW